MSKDGHLPLTYNRLLAALPEVDQQRLFPQLEIRSMKPKDGIYEPNKPIEYVYFPLSGVGSMLAVVDNHRLIEVGTVGNEGMLGIPVFLGTNETSIMSFWQVPGEAARLKSEALRAEIKRDSALVQVLQCYTQALFVMLAQHTACNRVHSIHQRAARWVLMTHDRAAEDNEFLLTQEFLSQMLGTRRASVNGVMRMFQEAGWLRYRRGVITILDRKGLENAACECYFIIKNEYDRMFE